MNVYIVSKKIYYQMDTAIFVIKKVKYLQKEINYLLKKKINNKILKKSNNKG